MFIQKLSGHLRRLRNARRFGVRLVRRGSFRMPERVKLPGGFIELSSPNENGARTDFLTCLLDDGFGLAGIRDQPATILDIGANIGFFAIAARSFFPSATIHCYAPNPRILSYLEKNAAASGADVFREAVGAGSGTVFLEERGDSNQARTAGATTGLAVPQVGLASAVERLHGKIDLAKIDIEGADTWALMGAESLLRDKRIGRIFYEENTTRMPELGISPGAAESFLHSQGYRVRRFDGGPSAAVSEFEAFPAV